MVHDPALAALLSAPFTLAMAADRGITRSAVRRRLEDGDLRRVTHGVYIGAHVPDTLALRAAATVLAIGHGAIACGRTAAWLWGVPTGPAVVARHRPVEIAVPPGVAVPRRQGCRARSTAWRPDEVGRVAGIPATNPLRTAVDIARHDDHATAVTVLDGMLHRRHLTHRQLEEAVTHYAPRPGGPALATAVAAANAAAASWVETTIRLALADAGVPAPVPGWTLQSALGRVMLRFAFAWPELRLAVDMTGPTRPTPGYGVIVEPGRTPGPGPVIGRDSGPAPRVGRGSGPVRVAERESEWVPLVGRRASRPLRVAEHDAGPIPAVGRASRPLPLADRVPGPVPAISHASGPFPAAGRPASSTHMPRNATAQSAQPPTPRHAAPALASPRRRNVAGSPWLVLECDAAVVAADPAALVAVIRRELDARGEHRPAAA
ncbi:hypothetical protein GCM10023205_64990 [Yinghuangia aomiensis]|uniref:AbiEi antitoxin N-terminal domain-containing protein n=1 Tax=Yinghuangia aomiensis TaxID=676205 RepID=A0ABP9I211_9ACTN